MTLNEPRIERLRTAVQEAPKFRLFGRVEKVIGLIIESNGPVASIGHLCHVSTHDSDGNIREIPVEVVGFRGSQTLLMPLGDLDGIRAGDLVHGTGEFMQVPVGESLLGRILDGIGQPLDDKPAPICEFHYPTMASPPNALQRRMIKDPLPTGVRAIDGLMTLCEGQRVGIFAGSGVGKSTLLGMIARNAQADINVICLVGERGREVREFIENDLGEEGLAKSVIICATGDMPALMRIKAAFTATAIAEGFRDMGKSVLLMMDSVTRFAMAQREIGLAVGEPPSAKGYTPSVFALLPRLMERAGMGPKGAITALYTVLVEGDDQNDPIADATRGILDGHLVLSRALTSRGHYPPIDVLQSLSRTMPFAVSPDQIIKANEFRELMAAYKDVEDLVSIGAYKRGSKPISDRAIDCQEGINRYLRQDKSDFSTYEESRCGVEQAIAPA
jgi:flagellum-specific ATP synthase